jgi:formate dehydrogenase
VQAKVTDEVMPGSVGMNPHYGQHGGRRVAIAIGGGRYNDLTPNDMADLDVSGIAWMNGIGVEIVPAPGETVEPAPPIAVGASA